MLKFSSANPFKLPVKKQADNSRFNKANLVNITTLLKTKEFYYDIITFISYFGKIANLKFNPYCPAIKDFLTNRPA